MAAALPGAACRSAAIERPGTPGRPLVAEPAELSSPPTSGNGPSTLSRRAIRPASKPAGATGTAGTGGTGTPTGSGGVGIGAGPSASDVAAPGAETAVSDAFAASAGAATQAALAKMLTAATPPRTIRRFFTARSFPDWAEAPEHGQ
jgi:hypothetical protein